MRSIEAMAIRGFVATLAVAAGGAVNADEGGVSFWLPGQFGSLTALQTDPGWSVVGAYYQMSGDAGRERSFPIGGRITAGLDAEADLVFLAPSYTFTTPVWGGQAALAVAGAYGRVKVDVDVTLTGPRGNEISGAESDSLTSGGDLYPLGTIKWKDGAHNYLTYAMAGIPVGSYDQGRLANIGIGHWSVDAGGGYTYFDNKNEFSAVLGVTYNFENTDTDYQNGVDLHLDWGASRFVAEGTHIGLVGYFYNQLSGDSGAGARLGDFKSRVSAVGPQIGQFLPIAGHLCYLNLRGYFEFEAKNRPEGRTLWLAISVPLAPTEH